MTNPLTEDEFIEFPKIARLSRECVVTEKLDGTNALVQITPYDAMCGANRGFLVETADGRFDVRCGLRTKWITPEDDNYGFAGWVFRNLNEIIKLGPGRHFGEWWGQAIQRKYGLNEKRWSLFNTSKWSDDAARPACCHVVPVIRKDFFDCINFDDILYFMKTRGSFAAPGFMNPEGIIIYHVQGNLYFKKTLVKDEEYKGKQS